MMNLGIYIHIPFCVKKCNYCDFVSFSNSDFSSYFEALEKEIDLYSDFLKERKIDSVFIGGGTPSCVPHNYISKTLSKIDISSDCEITIETNPKTLTFEKLKAYKDSGINRISIGMQSANDNELKILGRVHTFYDFLKSYELVINSGFTNINIDTMFGIPDQTFESFKNTLYEVKKLNPTHISSYSLIIEQNTPFYSMDLNLPDEETERRMFECLKEELSQYNRYEISNYAKEGYECRHNVKYWQMEDYLGLGLNSHSFICDTRFSNFSNMSDYISSLNNNKKPVAKTVKEDANELSKDYVITGLRMCKGINLDDYKDRFSKDFFKDNNSKIIKYIDMGFMELKEKNLFFTEKGFSVSNYILSDFI